MDIKDYTFIVFSEEQHYNPLGVVRSLGENGICPVVVGYGGKLRVVCKSKYVKEAYHVNTIADGMHLIIEHFKRVNQKSFIITCDDRTTQYLDERYDELKDFFYFGNAGKNGRITYYMDKNNINVLAKKHGLKVPKAHVVKKGEIREDFEYPVITKAISSNTGAWKKDVFVCKNADELKTAYGKIKSNTLLIEQYIDKTNELCIDGVSVNRGKEVFYSVASTYNYIIPGKFSYDYSSINFKNEQLIEGLNGMIGEIGYEGIFCPEFLIDKTGEYYFLEINFRNSGWSYTSTAIGMNLPIIWAKGMVEKTIPSNARIQIKEPFRTLVEFDDFKARVLSRKMGLLQWIKELKDVDCFLTYNKEDPKPFWIVFFDKFNRVKRIGKK